AARLELDRTVRLLQVIPVSFRHSAYDVIGQNRYRWFDQRMSVFCPIGAFGRNRILLVQPAPIEWRRESSSRPGQGKCRGNRKTEAVPLLELIPRGSAAPSPARCHHLEQSAWGQSRHIWSERAIGNVGHKPAHASHHSTPSSLDRGLGYPDGLPCGLPPFRSSCVKECAPKPRLRV